MLCVNVLMDFRKLPNCAACWVGFGFISCCLYQEKACCNEFLCMGTPCSSKVDIGFPKGLIL